RVVVMDRRGRIFLIHGHDIDDVNHHWWFTVGGGLLVGEDAREGAQRELAEETGLRVSPERLEGPVLRRSALFHFVGETRRQDETFFLLFLDDDEAASVGAGQELTDLEREVLDEFAWWDIEDLDALAQAAPVYPRTLPDLARSWAQGWDGTCPFIEEATGIGKH
ncbi:MAG: NUDIX domain-containing protein, partial [Actinomycetaceae bacterium]|nr:NUDIX domain-containing protein [Actinomycetaceae bacterium]